MSIASLKMPSYKADTGMSEVSLRSRLIGERAFPTLPMQYFGEIIRASYRSKSGFSSTATSNTARAKASLRQIASVS